MCTPWPFEKAILKDLSIWNPEVNKVVKSLVDQC